MAFCEVSNYFHGVRQKY